MLRYVTNSSFVWLMGKGARYPGGDDMLRAKMSVSDNGRLEIGSKRRVQRDLKS